MMALRHRHKILSAAVLTALLWLAPVAAETEPGDRPAIYTHTTTYGPYDLKADTLQQMPAGLVPLSFDEPVWVVGYSTEITSDGERPSRELHCHTVMMEWDEWSHLPAIGQPFKGVFSDGYTRQVILPPGYGIYFDAGETIDLMPMFNNRQSDSFSAEMSVSVHFLRAAEAPPDIIPLYSTIIAIEDSRLYMVPPGISSREVRFQLPYYGEMHAIGVHIHPYGHQIEVLNETRGNQVWNAVGKRGDDGRLLEMPFLSTAEGYPFGPEDRFLLRATYDNSSDVEQDAMAGLFIFFSTEDGKMPVIEGADTGAASDHGGHGSHADHGEHP